MSDQNDIPADEPVFDGRNEQQPDLPLDAPPQPQARPERSDEGPIIATLAEDPRDELVDKYRAKRDFEVEEDAANAAPPPPADNRPRYRVNVFGEEREVTQDELIRNYQINSAADVRLQEANARLAEAQRLLVAAQQPTYGDNGVTPPNQFYTEQPDEEPPTVQAGATDEQELRQFVESMQLGSTEEAVEAARKLLKTAVPQQPVDIGSQVDRVIATRSDDARSTAATERFLNHFPILDNPLAVGALHEASRVEMARDLAGLGLPLENVLSLDLDQVSSYHRAARLQGRPGFRQPEQILGSIARNPQFHAVAGASVGGGPVRVNVDRSVRKAQVQQQPALRNSAPMQQYQDPSQESRASRVVAQMRKERGQAVFGT